MKRPLKFIAVALLLMAIPPMWYLADLPDTSRLLKENPKTSAIRTHREEQTRNAGKKPHSSMIWKNLSQISPDLLHAVILSEDDTFYQHNGFDIEQIKRAARVNWERKRFAFGGSTLTQQLARSLYLSSRKNLLRKAKEALVTRRLEKTLSKDRILELYMNVVEWGPQVYGAEAAAQYFFQKPALELTSDEALGLASILPSPRRWNPASEKPYMVRRKAILYDRMVRASFIVPEISSGTETAPALEGEEPPAEDADDEDGEGAPDNPPAEEAPPAPAVPVQPG